MNQIVAGNTTAGILSVLLARFVLWVKRPKHEVTHYDSTDYPVGSTCPRCGFTTSIDPCTEEGLITIKDPVHGGRVLVAKCSNCNHISK